MGSPKTPESKHITASFPLILPNGASNYIIEGLWNKGGAAVGDLHPGYFRTLRFGGLAFRFQDFRV